jgi:hypothetical protein
MLMFILFNELYLSASMQNAFSMIYK